MYDTPSMLYYDPVYTKSVLTFTSITYEFIPESVKPSALVLLQLSFD